MNKCPNPLSKLRSTSSTLASPPPPPLRSLARAIAAGIDQASLSPAHRRVVKDAMRRSSRSMYWLDQAGTHSGSKPGVVGLPDGGR